LTAVRKVSFHNENKLTANFFDADSNRIFSPPTFFKQSDFTDAFQEIVNTYGIPRYKEINPALFNIITFPFLFGVMYGDIGHGFFLFLFGIYLTHQKDEIARSNSPLKAALPARYLLLFMGFFAFYCGWMYNDFLSIPLGIFGTCYENVKKIIKFYFI
jgi:V-type H+-transporting ATPase subunit a